MPNILDYYEYAKLATAAYVTLEEEPSLTGERIAFQANKQERLPSLLADQTFDSNKSGGQPVWTIPTGGYYGDDAEGFAATLFQRTDEGGATEKVLAIRGTEPFIDGSFDSTDLLKADLMHIGLAGFSLGQTVSMINYIRRLQADTRTDVEQLALNFTLVRPEAGTPSIELRAKPNEPVKGYLSLVETESKPGLGLIGAGEQITVTGHSLGGHLAANEVDWRAAA